MSSLSVVRAARLFLSLLVVLAFSVVGMASAEPADSSAVSRYLSQAPEFADAGDRIASLSEIFLGAPYEPGTLVGGPDVPEKLVINFSTFDCLTYLETIEALRRCDDFEQFASNLSKVRYFQSEIAYGSRRHFFSDWLIGSRGFLEDVTSSVAPEQFEIVTKMLNRKESGEQWLPEIPVTRRQIRYISGKRINHDILTRLRTGDFVGIYSPLAGLDVSHVGIAIRSEGGLFFRHASSSKEINKVIDVPLADYLAERPGMIVYRAVEP